MDEATKQIKEYTSKLPPAVQKAITSAEWSKRIGEIGHKYSLHLDQISALEYETLFIMIGMEPTEDFVANIEKEVGVSHIVAEQIAEEVNERVFKLILKSIEERTAPEEDRFAKAQPVASDADQYVVGEESRVITENPLLSEIETMANDAPTVPHLPKTVEPPLDLPGIEEVTEKPDMVVLPASSVPTTPSFTPTASIPEPVKTSSLADIKLGNTVESQTETKIVKSYTADPYREPIE